MLNRLITSISHPERRSQRSHHLFSCKGIFIIFLYIHAHLFKFLPCCHVLQVGWFGSYGTSAIHGQRVESGTRFKLAHEIDYYVSSLHSTMSLHPLLTMCLLLGQSHLFTRCVTRVLPYFAQFWFLDSDEFSDLFPFLYLFIYNPSLLGSF